MSEKELLQKIKKLKAIGPSSKWLVSARQNLLRQIGFEQRSVLPDFSFNWLKELQALAVVVFIGLFFLAGPWLTASASKNSLPGETLYPFKKLTEKIQTILASESSKTQLGVNFAARRIAELSKITGTSVSEQAKTEQTREIISQFKNNLTDASIYAEKLSRENAMAVARKTIVIKKELTELTQTAKGSSLEVKADLAEAGKKIEEINNKILAVLSKENKQDTDVRDDVLDQEIFIFINENLEKETSTASTTLPLLQEPLPTPAEPQPQNSNTGLPSAD